MQDDILRFRKLYEVLKKEKHLTNKQLQDDIGISEPTLKKLLTEDISTLKLRPSILGIVQDYIRKHIDTLNYAGIKPDPETVEKLKNNLRNYQPETGKETPEPEPEKPPQIIDLLQQISKLVPGNIQIIINPGK